MDLPSVEKISLINFRKTAAQAFYISTKSDNGPVHINFPFEKPLGPNTFNTEIDKRIFRLAKKEKISIGTGTNSFSITGLKSISKKIVTSKKGWIIAGPMELNQFLIKKIILLSELTGFPVLADGISNLRWINSERIFSNYNLFYKSTTFFEKNIPELIIQFGRTPTSMILEKFFQNKKISIYSIDKFGDRFDSGNKSVKIIKADPGEFCDNVLNQIKKENNDTPTYFEQIQFAESTSEKIKNRYLSTKNFKLEPVLLYNIIRNLPAKTRVIIGNSLPVRDLDNFIKENHEIEFYFNRGASGIDGVTSTAAGVASQGVTTVLITGDLSFLHDLNALMVMKKYPLPLTIFVINNNGGAIFNSLPAASGNKLIDKFFITPHNLKIGEIVTSFGLKYVEVKSIDELTYISMNVNEKKACAVVEIKTNPVKSKKFREKIFTKVEKQITRGTL